MSDAFAHCEELVRERDRDRFLATLFAPADRRGGLFALYAFNSELARIRDLAREPLPGEIRLQWWREVIEGQRHGEAAAHPVAAAFLETIGRYGLSPELLLAMIDARAFDIYDDPMAGRSELESYAYAIEGTVIEMAVRILGGSDAVVATNTGLAWTQAGLALTFAGILTGLPRHASRRQLYIPLDLAIRHGAQPEDLFAGKVTPEWHAALKNLRQWAWRPLKIVGLMIADLPLATLPALLPLAPLRPLFERMDRDNYDPFHPPELPAWRRQWRIWRAARNPKRIAA